jgi:hypothetical protein
MPAPDYETIYDLEGQLETGIAAALTTAGLTAYKSLATGDKTAPFVTVQVTVNEAQEKYTTVLRGNEAWGFSCELQIVTNRTDDTGPADHVTYRKESRHAMERWLSSQSATGGGNLNAQLTYLSIERLVRSGGSRGVDSGERFDLTTDTYNGIARVKETSWPT